MSDEQILAFFDYKREEDGSPILSRPGEGQQPTPRYLHERWCFARGVTEPEDIERLWQEHEKKRREKRKERRKR